MSPVVLFWFVLGLVALVVGAELLVRGASGLARAMGISSLVVGLTVVSFGTSAPELSISLLSLLQGQADLSVGNVVGSNIANILLILGSAALIAPLVVSAQLIRLDVPIMIVASMVVFFMSLNGSLGRGEGFVLFAGLVVYTVTLIKLQKDRPRARDKQWKEREEERKPKRVLTRIVMIVVGLALLVKGAGWLVSSATVFARSMGVSDLVIGLTVVAGGTSLPELATSLIAAFRGERDIAIGNVVGSCILNLLLVLGAACVVAPDGLHFSPAVISFDMPIMIAASVACLPILFTDHMIARWEGLLFISYYVAYTVFLVLRGSHHDSLPLFSSVMQVYVIPLTVVTLLVLTVRAIKRQRVVK